MHPTIANLLADQRRQELLATADRRRRVRPSTRTSWARTAGLEGRVRGHPLTFQTWLAAGRL